MSGTGSAPSGRDFERIIGRMLILLTYVSVALLIVGVLLMLRDGISPLDGAPPFDPATIPADIVAPQADRVPVARAARGHRHADPPGHRRGRRVRA